MCAELPDELWTQIYSTGPSALHLPPCMRQHAQVYILPHASALPLSAARFQRAAATVQGPEELNHGLGKSATLSGSDLHLPGY